MIRCTPKGLCSWNYYLDGEGHCASLEFNWLGEEGRITADGIALDVRKHGVFSGLWTLQREGKQVASAQKSTAFTRTFEIEELSGRLVLRAEFPIGRSFRVERPGGERVAAIAPVHPFTRRATIDVFAPQWEFVTASFTFWLVVLTWRRAAKSSNSGGGG